MDIEQARLLTVGDRKLSEFTESEWNETYKRNTRSRSSGFRSPNSGNSYWTQANMGFQVLKNAGEIKKEESVEPESKSTKDPFYKRWYHKITPKSWRKKHKPRFSRGNIYGNEIHPIKIRGGYKKRRTMKRRKSLKRKTMKRRKSLKRSNSLKRKTIKRRKNRIK